MTLKKLEDIGALERKHQIVLCGEPNLEMSLNLS